MYCKSIRYALMLATFLAFTCAQAEDAHDMKPLVDSLSKSKVTLLDGFRQAAKSHGTVISGKFEMEDGKLSLSVYTGEKGLNVTAEQNVLEELSGSPEDKWEPKVDVFKDVEHISRSAEQLAIVALGHTSTADLLSCVPKD